MKRILIGLLLVLAVVALGGHYYYERQVEKRVESGARLIGQMGGTLDYREVAIALSGDIRIEDILLRVPGMPTSVSIDRVSLHTGGLLGVHRLAMDARDQLLPTRLGLSLEGIRIPLSSVTQASNSSVADNLAAAGCGDRRGFSALDIVNMGYSEYVMDTRVDYQLVGSGELLSVTIDTQMRDMHHTRVELEFSLGAPSRHAAAVAMAASGAQVLNVAIDYQDKGYAQSVIDFCTEATGLDREAYLAQHLEAWQEGWKHFGLVAGPQMIDVYQQFLDNPDELSMQIKPYGGLEADDLAGLSPELLLQYLRMQVAVNQNSMVPLDLSVMDEATAESWRAQQRERAAEIGSQAGGSTGGEGSSADDGPDEGRIAVENLRNYRGARVAIQLTNERTLEGVIHSLGEDRLQLQRFQSGGYVIQPVSYADIAEVYLQAE